MKRKLEEFDVEIKQRLKLEELGTDGDKPDTHQWADLLDVDPDFREEFFQVYQDDDIKKADEESSSEISDVQFLNMELALSKQQLTVITDTGVFEVEYFDGHTTTMSANTIAECMFAKVDREGCQLLLFQEVIDHRSIKDAVTQVDAFTNTSNGRRGRKPTTKGWELHFT
jgi:hypothetical protein